MDRQEEYELRQKISDAIAKDVSNVMADALRACNSNFSLEIMYPLELLERMYKRKSYESFEMGLFPNNEMIITVNPLREAIFWFIKNALKTDKKLRYDNEVTDEMRKADDGLIEFVLRLHDEHLKGIQIREIRDCFSKVKICKEGANKYSFYFPRIEEGYNKELLYYYGLDDSLNSQKEREVFIDCENYLMNKINVRELAYYPQKVSIYRNILTNMASHIDKKYWELCKRRVLSDLNKVSTGALESIDAVGRHIINSKDELASFLGLLVYLSRLCMQKYMISIGTGMFPTEYICIYDLPKLLALGKQVGISREACMNYIDYFSIDPNIGEGNFTEFPLIKWKEKIIWIPSSVILNDFQFSIVNGHYLKQLDFINKDSTVSQSIVDYITNHCKVYKNIIYNTNYCYSVKGKTFNGKPFNSDIDVAIYDKANNCMIIIECKWKENVYLYRENYVRIQDAFKKIFDNQLGKHQAYLGLASSNISMLFDNVIDFSSISGLDTLYLFVDKRIQYHDCENNRHAIPIFILAHLFEKYSENGEMNLAKVIEEIHNMNNHVEYERVSLSKTVQIDDITLI